MIRGLSKPPAEAARFILLLNAALAAIPANQRHHIRSCAICRQIFWAARVTSECCSLRCRKTYNQRNSRAHRR